MSASLPLVLVVEDDDDIRSLLCMALPLHGFRVLPACDGAEALELSRRHSEPIGLAVLDVLMPGLSGPQTLVALREIHPNLLACFVTGFGAEHAQDGALQATGCRVFTKPFRVAEVAAHLWHLHGGEPAP